MFLSHFLKLSTAHKDISLHPRVQRIIKADAGSGEAVALREESREKLMLRNHLSTKSF